MLTRGFGRKDVRIFFLQLAYPPETVEVAVFAGSAVATTYREVTVWKEIIEPAIATTYPKYVINGFVVRLDATAQFTSGTPLFVPKYKTKQKKAPQR